MSVRLPAPFYRDTSVHDEDGAVKPAAQMSSNEYVRIRAEGSPKPGRLWIRPVRNCNHGVTICEECAESWEFDHAVDYHWTLGGRALLQRLLNVDNTDSEVA